MAYRIGIPMYAITVFLSKFFILPKVVLRVQNSLLHLQPVTIWSDTLHATEPENAKGRSKAPSCSSSHLSKRLLDDFGNDA